jgi:hypothetical protein
VAAPLGHATVLSLTTVPALLRGPQYARISTSPGLHSPHGIWFNDHIEEDGETVFRHACKLELEGIGSKQKDSTDGNGRSADWRARR